MALVVPPQAQVPPSYLDPEDPARPPSQEVPPPVVVLLVVDPSVVAPVEPRAVLEAASPVAFLVDLVVAVLLEAVLVEEGRAGKRPREALVVVLEGVRLEPRRKAQKAIPVEGLLEEAPLAAALEVRQDSLQGQLALLPVELPPAGVLLVVVRAAEVP